MAEGLLDALTGGGDDEAHEVPGELKPDESTQRLEAFAIALAATICGQDPSVASKTEEFLTEQIALARLERESLEAGREADREESQLRRQSLRRQALEGALRRTAIVIRLIFSAVVACAAVAVLTVVAIFLHDAVTSRRVVIEPMRVSPALEEKVDGRIFATGLLDDLARLQAETRSVFVPLNAAGAWSGDIKIEIPETSISLGEISRVLRERFGNEIHIEGDLIDTSAGLVLAVRGSGVPPKTFTGTQEKIDQITLEAAQYIFAQSQPLRWAAYLLTNRRYDDVIAFAQTALPTRDSETQAHLLNDWAVALQNKGAALEALDVFRAAVARKPDFWYAWNNIADVLWLLGKEEEAWQFEEEMRKAVGGRPGRAPETAYSTTDALTWNLDSALNGLIAANAVGPYSGPTVGPQLALLYLLKHDPSAAKTALLTTRRDLNDVTIPAVTHLARGWLAADAGDTAEAARELEEFAEAYSLPEVGGLYPGYQCWVAPAEEAAGRPEKADAVLASAGSFLDCYRFRGDILDHRGDWVGAQSAYQKAIAIAPDLPAGYYSWGLALDRHGDQLQAEKQLRMACKRGPQWADPFKALGDVLSKQGERQKALRAYDEALTHAPNWDALRRARDAAAR
jgi:tetratricopeptide (TPR) repeat protein